MALSKFADGSCFVPIRSGQTCPVCGSRTGRCAEFYNTDGEKAFYRCKYKESSRHSNGWYLHLVSEIDGINTTKRPSETLQLHRPLEFEITEEILDLRDKVYRKMRDLIREYLDKTLYQDDEENLLRRGLTEAEIERMGVFSVPKGNILFKVSRKLVNLFGEDTLLKVAGFIKTQKGVMMKGYIKGNKVDGFFVPYSDYKGRLTGLQIRLKTPVMDDSGKQVRYFWFSSKQARSGSPIDYYVPSKVKREDVLMVIEGGLKAKIASEKLSYKTLALAGVSNYNNLVKALQELELRTCTQYKIITAYDMDKFSNEEVMKAEETLISLLKGTGHQVATAEWDEVQKGIDDAYQAKLEISFKLI